MTPPQADGLSGWVLVPREPVETMIVAGAHALFDVIEAGAERASPPPTDRWDRATLPKRAGATTTYRAMIALSPPIPNGLAEAIAREIDDYINGRHGPWKPEDAAQAIITLLTTGAESK